MIYIGDVYKSDSFQIIDHILGIKNNKVQSLYYTKFVPLQGLSIYDEHYLDSYINIYYKLD